jgi:outer membrane protein TolC
MRIWRRHSRTREQRARKKKLVTALSESVRLSTLRYRGGLDSYLQVLDAGAEPVRRPAHAGAVAALELQSVVQLYRALGGGWQFTPSMVPDGVS